MVVPREGVIALLLQLAAGQVGSLRCYNCHQTTAACIDGNVGKLQTKDCPGHCRTIKYETNMSGKMVPATVRGCEHDPDFRPENPVSRIVYDTCDRSLCNAAPAPAVSFFCGTLLLCPLLLLYNTFRVFDT